MSGPLSGSLHSCGQPSEHLLARIWGCRPKSWSHTKKFRNFQYFLSTTPFTCKPINFLVKSFNDCDIVLLTIMHLLNYQSHFHHAVATTQSRDMWYSCPGGVWLAETEQKQDGRCFGSGDLWVAHWHNLQCRHRDLEHDRSFKQTIVTRVAPTKLAGVERFFCSWWQRRCLIWRCCRKIRPI